MNPRLTLGRAWDLLESLIPQIAEACPALDALVPAGDVRRFEPLVSTLVLVGRAANPRSAISDLRALHGIKRSRLRETKTALSQQIVIGYENTDVELIVAAPQEFGSALFAATGAALHVDAIRARGGTGACPDERELYHRAGLPLIAPEIRNASGEIEAAASKALPSLVTRTDIRGDLHMHSTYSDGRDTVASMIDACAALGYEYAAITDHSEGAAASRTLAVSEIAQQRDDLEAARERFPSMTILHGIEVDILPDGRLDFADAILEEFEIVLASLHDPAGQDRRQLTRRCLEAIRHPLVTVLTHPANRLVGHRDGYDLDFDSIYAAAAESGTALEIDGAPSHLDLDGEHARAAVAAGVMLTIDSDCHRASGLERQMQFGVGTARRGWIEPTQVLNTRSADGIRAFVEAKRTRRRYK